jgi:hypothetical protein
MRRDYNNYNFSSLVKINEDSPSGLIWVAPRLYAKTLKYDRVGQPAGRITCFNDRQSYFTINLFGQTFFVHRIIYTLKHGSVSIDKDVDHKDGNSLNNRVENLREVQRAVNNRNKSKPKHKELCLGVYLEEFTTKAGNNFSKIRAHYSFNNVVHSRTWSVLKYGQSEALRLALDWITTKIAELNSDGAGYSERHGTQ